MGHAERNLQPVAFTPHCWHLPGKCKSSKKRRGPNPPGLAQGCTNASLLPNPFQNQPSPDPQGWALPQTGESHSFSSCSSPVLPLNKGSQLKWVDLQDFHFTRRFQLLHALFSFGFRTKKPKSSRTLSSDELSNSETARNQNFPLTLLRSHFAISLFHFSILDYFELFLQHFPMLNATLSITQHSYEGVIM